MSHGKYQDDQDFHILIVEYVVLSVRFQLFSNFQFSYIYSVVQLYTNVTCCHIPLLNVVSQVKSANHQENLSLYVDDET
jgi:hypothetical protein